VGDVIICAAWNEKDERFHSRHYHAWDRACSSCGSKVVVGAADKRRLDGGTGVKLLCEPCALIAWQEGTLDLPSDDESVLEVAEESCAICEELKRQEEAAAVESARCRGLPDRAADQLAASKWEHISRARWAHRFRAHMDERRGR
jgi:hypothetical protein